MEVWLAEAAAGLIDRPVLQALLTFAATTFMEKPTTVACGFLIAEGAMSGAAAFFGLTGGIMLGDMALYVMGRYASGPVSRWRIARPARMARASSWYARNLIPAVLVCRGIPGFRVPVFVSAGILRTPFWRLALTDLLASAVWAVVLLTLIRYLGERFLPVFGQFKWPAIIGVIVLIVIGNAVIARYARKAAANDPADPAGPAG